MKTLFIYIKSTTLFTLIKSLQVYNTNIFYFRIFFRIQKPDGCSQPKIRLGYKLTEKPTKKINESDHYRAMKTTEL